MELPEILVGQSLNVELSLACLTAGGHLLLEGQPGVGKTTLAKGLAGLYSGRMTRIQMTSDLLPSDLLGYYRPRPGSMDLELKRGPIFTEVLLADELNRAPPKTQSALLEAMAEGQVTLDGQTLLLPRPFFVVATQNPLDSHGVFPLAESELDRFLMRLEIGLPDLAQETGLWLHSPFGELGKTVASRGRWEDLRVLQANVQNIAVEKSVFDYGQKIIVALRSDSEIRNTVSVRGAQHLFLGARSLAQVRGRAFVIPKDLQDIAGPVLSHRIQLRVEGLSLAENRSFVDRKISQISPPT